MLLYGRQRRARVRFVFAPVLFSELSAPPPSLHHPRFYQKKDQQTSFSITSTPPVSACKFKPWRA